MSRSRFKYPAGSGRSEKWGKAHCNRAWRARLRRLLANGEYDAAQVDDWFIHLSTFRDRYGWWGDRVYHGDAFATPWQLLRTARKYKVKRVPQRLFSVYQWTRGGLRHPEKYDKMLRK